MRLGETVIVALALCGGGAAGFLLGKSGSDEPERRRAEAPRAEALADRRRDPFDDEPAGIEPDGSHEPVSQALLRGDETTPQDLLAALRRNAGSPVGQKVLTAYVAQAAVRGSEMLPEIMDLLRSGENIALSGYGSGVVGLGTGYPNLRMALMDAAAATGDPAATELLREVAKTTESPVEVVFSAHLLEQLDTLDKPTAERALDALSVELDEEQAKAVGSMANKIVPAAARVSPVYAENLLSERLRSKKELRANLRLLTPVLDGLPTERAEALVLSILPDPAVSGRAKRAFAGRAAGRPELQMLRGLREGIEAGTVEPRIASQVARSAVASGVYGGFERKARTALKNNDLDGALRHSLSYTQRLEEARLTLKAARASGARYSPQLNKLAEIRAIRLRELNERIARYKRRLEREQKSQQNK